MCAEWKRIDAREERRKKEWEGEFVCVEAGRMSLPMRMLGRKKRVR